MGKFVTVTHWNGYVLRGTIVDGDGSGIFVAPQGMANARHIYCSWQNVKRVDIMP